MNKRKILRIIGVILLIPEIIYLVSHIPYLQWGIISGNSRLLVYLIEILWWPFIYTDALRYYIGHLSTLAFSLLILSCFISVDTSEKRSEK